MDKDPREILVIKPSSLGDVVHTLPAVALVKKHWPEAPPPVAHQSRMGAAARRKSPCR
ncbi:MAG: hypothetical protein WDN28_27770 [Chthoniobacter sp.]